MAVLQYIGARYVPKLFNDGQGGMEWQADTYYEPLTIVTYNNASYISRTPVPAGIGNPAVNGTYWAASGNFNAQVAQLQEDVNGILQKTGYQTLTSLGVPDSGDVTLEVQKAVDHCAQSGEVLFFDKDVSIRQLTISHYQVIDFSGGKINALPGDNIDYFMNFEIRTNTLNPDLGFSNGYFRGIWIDMNNIDNATYAIRLFGRNLFFDSIRIYGVANSGLYLGQITNYSTEGIYVGQLRILGVGAIGARIEVGDAYFSYTEISGFNTQISLDRGRTTVGYAYDNMFGAVHLWGDALGMDVNVDALSIDCLILDGLSNGVKLSSKCKMRVGTIINVLVKDYLFIAPLSANGDDLIVDCIENFVQEKFFGVNGTSSVNNFKGVLNGNVLSLSVSVEYQGATLGTMNCRKCGKTISLTYNSRPEAASGVSAPALPPCFRPVGMIIIPLYPIDPSVPLTNLGVLYVTSTQVNVRQNTTYLYGTNSGVN